MTTFIVTIVATQILAFVFLIAGAAKAFDPNGSMQSVVAYGLLPSPMARVLGMGLPWIEILVATLLIVHIAISYALLLATAMLATFLVAQAAVIYGGKLVPCGCFGSDEKEPVNWKTVMRSFILATLAAFSLWGCIVSRNQSFDWHKILVIQVMTITALLLGLALAQSLENQGRLVTSQIAHGDPGESAEARSDSSPASDRHFEPNSV